MKHTIQLFVLCMLCLAFNTSCTKNSANNKESDWMSKTRPEYDQERQVIYFKEQLSNDIKGDIDFPFDINRPNHFEIACRFSVFNYGEDIRLLNYCIDDCFITDFGTINCAYLLKSEDNIEIASKRHSKKYGDWALVNLTIGNIIVNDVFMTPLSMKAYNDGDDDSFIFIQFVNNNNYMNVLFYGGSTECIIVAKCQNKIISSCAHPFIIKRGKSYPGQFWKQNIIDN